MLGFSLLIAIWFGLLTGLLEVVLRTVQGFYVSRTREVSHDFIWMCPLANAGILFLLGLVIFFVSRFWPKLNLLRLTIFLSALWGFMDLIILYPKIHHYAALLLAAGLATQTLRLISPHMLSFQKLVRRTLPWMGLLVGMLAISVQGKQILAERRALADLTPAPPYAPNVLFITLDTVRARNLSVYGYSRPTTPQLEQLAKMGVVFERALSTAPWTLPSHASMFTGRFPGELSADWLTPLDSTYPTLAEFFRARGYLTAGFVGNTGYCSYEHGLDRGFIHYEDYRISLGQTVASSMLTRTIADNFRLRRILRNDEHLNRQPADQINEKVLRWFSHKEQRPFFVFINYYDAHEPYLPPPPYDKMFGPGRKYGKFSPLHRHNWEPAVMHRKLSPEEVQEEIDAYDGAIAYIDHQLGQLLNELGRKGLLENTLIIITSDHGEEFGEHGIFDHGNSLYLPTVHVPLLIVFPSKVPAGKRIHEPVSLRDLAATVVDLTRLGGDPHFPGKSLARYWNMPAQAPGLEETPLLSEVSRVTGRPTWFPVSRGDVKALIFNGMRYIKNGDGVEELYDFENDPWEQRNLANLEESSQILNQFRALLEKILKSEARSQNSG